MLEYLVSSWYSSLERLRRHVLIGYVVVGVGFESLKTPCGPQSSFFLLPVCGSRCGRPADPATVPWLSYDGSKTVSPINTFFYKLI